MTIKSATVISVNCSVGTNFMLLLGDGMHASGGGASAQRQLAGTAGSLMYGLFQDGARTTPWGDGINGGSGEAGSGNGGAKPFVVYASLDVLATSLPGSYSDSLQITVSF